MGLKSSLNLFSNSPVGVSRLVLYLALSIILMVLDHQYRMLWYLRYRVALVVEPVYKLVNLPSVGMHAVVTFFTDRSLLNEQNQHLREELLLAHARLNQMNAYAEQNQHLKKLLNVRRDFTLQTQLARIVSVDLDGYQPRLGLNVGANQGVQVGQPVIDAHGVMGQVVQVLPSMSILMLITDPDSAIPVVLPRTGLRTVAYGSRDGNHLSLPTIPRSANVRIGDKLLTSGIGGRFPPGFPVAKVMAVMPVATGMFFEAWADPDARLYRSRNVLLLHDLAAPVGPPKPGVKPIVWHKSKIQMGTWR